MNYNWVERLFLFFFPEACLEGTAWRNLWEQERRARFIFACKIFFPIAALIYIVHYFFVDIPMGIAPSELWFNYRFSMAGLSVGCLLFYVSPIAKSAKYYKIPAMIACWVFCYLQARTIVWYDQVPYLYAPLFVYIAALILQLNVTKSVIYSAAILLTQWPSLVAGHVAVSMAASSDLVALFFIAFSRSGLLAEIRHFVLMQEKIDVQTKMIRSNMEFTDRIKAFLPKEISRRLTDLMARNRLSVLQAADEVLRPKKRGITCLFSDIRGFTENSKQLDYLTATIIPNIKQSGDIIENFTGIPRKIGDLVFAYFDSTSMEENVINSLAAAFQIAKATLKFNSAQRDSQPIVRYVLLSSGSAIVGNLGSFDSSVEITALGTPVNLLSRIDELTKDRAFQAKIKPDNIIVSAEYVSELSRLLPQLQIIKIDLIEFGLKVRNFESETAVYRIELSETNEKIIFNFIEQIQHFSEKAIA